MESPDRIFRLMDPQKDLLLTESGIFRLYYEDGTEDDRVALIEDGSLRYRVFNASVPAASGGTKARVQLDGPVGMSDLVAIMTMKLHPDMEYYRTMPGPNDWFTTLEIWVNRHNASSPNQFRVTVDIAKQDSDGLYFTATGRSGTRGSWKNEWAAAGSSMEVPVGEQFTFSVAYSQSRGRFVLAMNGVKLIDVNGKMYDLEPSPVTNFSPAKIYAGSKVVEHVRNNGGEVSVEWGSIAVVGEA